MGPNKNLFFLAVMPPEDIQEEVKNIKLEFKDQYGSEHALNSPAHLTLVPPFQWPAEKEAPLVQNLDHFCKDENTFEVALNGFGAFKPRVIYIDVKKNIFLSDLHDRLRNYLNENCIISELLREKKPFNPHMTVAFRDLTKDNFYVAWNEFKNKNFHALFTVDKIVLLIHRQKRWEVSHQSFFGKNQQFHL
jgi:2'-5' RNA ligase